MDDLNKPEIGFPVKDWSSVNQELDALDAYITYRKKNISSGEDAFIDNEVENDCYV